jgi:hypothetical protein
VAEREPKKKKALDSLTLSAAAVERSKALKTEIIGHVERMEDSRMSKRVMREKIYTKRRRGRPKVRWLDDVQEDLTDDRGLKDGEGKPKIETCGGE